MRELTPQQLEKDVKRINERINEVVKLLGADSEAYQKYVARLKSLLPSQFVRVDKDGLFKIARKKELYNRAGDEKIQRAFEQILKTPTAGDIKKNARRVIKEERKKKLQEDQERARALPEVPGEEFPDLPPEYQGLGNGAMIKEPLKPTQAEIIDKAKQMDRVEKFVSDNQEMFYVTFKNTEINDIIHIRGRKKTYAELQKIIDEYEADQYDTVTSIFDDLEF